MCGIRRRHKKAVVQRAIELIAEADNIIKARSREGHFLVGMFENAGMLSD